MIIVRLMGGLGNQLFQYALGRRLALLHSQKLKLDCSMLSAADVPRNYELRHFNIDADFASRVDVSRLDQSRSRGLAGAALRIKHRLQFGRRRTHIVEKGVAFDPAILAFCSDVLLEGYWQSHLYFHEIEALIRKEFTLRDTPDSRSLARHKEISAVQSVCIHVRRGDYVNHPQTRRSHGLCSQMYYENAARVLAGTIRYPVYFVFSDEPDWVRSQFKIPFPFVCVESSLDRPHQDLWLMSACKYFVIANSSFSWWGAWLSDNPEKRVIAPRKWGEDPAFNVESRFPPDWILME